MSITIKDYFLLFLIYSFIGWSIEVIRELIRTKKFINRGFLIGPYCPIYGVGCLAIVFLLSKYEKDPLTLFTLTLILCSILEYATSYIMEKLFHTRWWDYSNRKYNLNGRICLETMIPFGLCGLLVIYILNPFFLSVLIKIPNSIKLAITIPLFLLVLLDIIISFKIITNLKGMISLENRDGTEEINKKVKEILTKGNNLYRRLLDSFPHIKLPK